MTSGQAEALDSRAGQAVYSNRSDSAAGLRAALEASFADVSIAVRGAVALFSARQPRTVAAT